MPQSPENFKITLPAEEVEGRIYLIREHRVMLDTDVAMLYQVPTPTVDEAVLNNSQRFPKDFYFTLTYDELKALKDQVGFIPVDDGTPTIAFTESGVAMLACVLQSPQAMRMSIAIMRSFVQFREVCVPKELTMTKEELGDVLASLANALQNMDEKQDARTQALLQTIQKMVHGADPPKERRIGFDVD